MNPFIKADGLPEFKNVTVENCKSKVGSQTLALEKAVADVEEYLHSVDKDGVKPSVSEVFNSIFDPLEKATQQMNVTWGLAKTLYTGSNILMPQNSYLKMHNRGRVAAQKKFLSLPILTALSELRQRAKDSNELTPEQLRVLDLYILECKLNGVGVHKDSTERLEYVKHMCHRQEKIYNDKLKVALQQFSHTITEYSEVRSYPPKLLQAMSTDPKNHLTGPWKVTLHRNIYNGFMENCPDRLQRWNVWQAYTRKASLVSIRELQNSTHIEEIRHWRYELAEVLGYKTYADMIMETKMIGSVQKAKQMIKELLEYARPNQEVELQKLFEFAIKNGFNGKELEAHDIPYWRKKQILEVSKCDHDLIQDYFPLTKVLDGLFTLSENLFKIKIVERLEDKSSWHPDVKYYDVFDLSQSTLATDSGKPIAGFYMDLYDRDEEKMHSDDDRQNGWNIGIRSRTKAGLHTIPLLSILFNFTTPLYGKPCLLSLQEVNLLFCRFGHALQHLLTEANYSAVSGNAGVEWDAVAVSANVLGNILHERDVLKSISEHVATKEPLSDQLIDSILSARYSLSGYKLSQELYFSAFDLELYTRKDFWLDILRRIWPQYQVLKLDKMDSHLCSMPELITGPFACAYFSHIHAQMLAADIHDAFLEARKSKNPTDLEDVGQRYRQTFLALGGSVHSKEVFRRFRGRDPSPKALVTQWGLTEIKPYVALKDITLDTSTKLK